MFSYLEEINEWSILSFNTALIDASQYFFMIKKILFEHCLDYLNNRLASFEKRKLDLLKALESESKSSAGDKHETGRAMLQLEREKLGEQLKGTEQNLTLLLSLENPLSTKTVSLGAVVKTSHLNYYIAIAVPAFEKNNNAYYCISAQSPIGKLLLGKKVGEKITFNNVTSIITEIL